MTDDAVSGEHLSIWWGESAWQIRDLGSTNGSLRNGVRLDPGQTQTLAVDDVITVGRSDHAWVIEDLAPPIAFAIAQGSGARVLSKGDVLALPTQAEAEALISVDAQGEWMVETPAGIEAIADRHVLELSDGVWRVHLPEEHRGTVDASLTAAPSKASALRFRVSLDEEYVELQCSVGEHTAELGARAHHYLLLLLARQRQTDAHDDVLPTSSHGWVHTEALMNMLQVPETHINVQIFRARKQFLRAGFGPELTPIERRPGAGLLRIGTGQLHIESI